MCSPVEDGLDTINPIQQKKHILSLSDEVLVHICSFLSGEEIVSLSFVCRRFNDVLCERKLVRCLNLRAVYSLTSDVLRKFLQPLVRCSYIDTISLASCYWLTSADLSWSIQRLPNLRCLYIDDTNLSIDHLTRIFKTVKSIERLSWTFHMTNKISVGTVKKLSEQLISLKSLDLWVKGFASAFLPLLLRKCSSLEELKLSSYKYRDVPWDRTEFLDSSIKVCLPNMKSIILNIPENINNAWYVFLEELFRKCRMNYWSCLWLDTRSDISKEINGEDSKLLVERNIKELWAISLELLNEEILHLLMSKSLKVFKFSTTKYESKFDLPMRNSLITHLLWRSESMPLTLPTCLQHLCISCTNMRIHMPDRSLISYDLLPHLTRLSVPACLLLAGNAEADCFMATFEDVSFKKDSNKRYLLKKETSMDCFLRLFTEVAPNIRDLEFKCRPSCHKNSPDELRSLALIGRWSQLESLFLENIQLTDSSLLVTICMGCPKLRRLGLRYVGLIVGLPFTWNIARAINMLEFLEDFRFEHYTAQKLDGIVDALSNRPNLRRVSIICEKMAAPQQMSLYLNLVEKCSRLVFLFVRIASITQKMEKDFQRALKAKYLSKRKSLWASIEGVDKDHFWEAIPSIHCYEMIFDPALLSVMPSSKGCS